MDTSLGTGNCRDYRRGLIEEELQEAEEGVEYKEDR
jgi:hypothetical protein